MYPGWAPRRTVKAKEREDVLEDAEAEPKGGHEERQREGDVAGGRTRHRGRVTPESQGCSSSPRAGAQRRRTLRELSWALAEWKAPPKTKGASSG